MIMWPTVLFLEVKSSRGVAHRLHLTITFLSLSLTNLKNNRKGVSLADVESVSAVSSTITFQQQEIIFYSWNVLHVWSILKKKKSVWFQVEMC